MRHRRLYLDTSAYLCILLAEDGWERLSENTAGAMDRVEEDTNVFVFRDLAPDLCDSNILPAIAPPRSLDLAHLRTALWFHAAERVERVVTMDASQKQAARELGLPV